MRVTIERAFGMLAARWGIFWRPLICAVDRWPSVIQVAAKLDNVCIDSNIPVQQGVFEDYAPGDLPSAVFMNQFNPENGFTTGYSHCHASSMKRMMLTDRLSSHGITRPRHAKDNSRAF
jgi:hypothetical protein